MRQLLLLFTVLVGFAVPSTSLAGKDEDAERLRLREEMLELASRNAWKGVDRNYAKLISEELRPEVSDHLLGAQASTNLGEILVAVDRLETAVAVTLPEEGADSSQVEAHASAKTQLEDLLQRYGKVDISVGGKRVPGLIRFELPFGTEERETIQRAREVLVEKGAYKGLLPVGGYMIDGVKFDVANSMDWQAIKVE